MVRTGLEGSAEHGRELRTIAAERDGRRGDLAGREESDVERVRQVRGGRVGKGIG
jgi:hypothetical protein